MAQNHFVQAEGNFVLESGFLVLADSDFTNDANFSSSNGTVKMSGSAADANSEIGGTSNTTFHNLHISKTANNVLLKTDATVAGDLKMEAGHLDLQAADLTATNTITGATTDRYIKTSGTGELKRQVAAAEIEFPVGNSSYNPAKLTNTGTADVIGLRVTDEVLTGLTTGDAATDASLDRTWHASEGTTGGANLAINLQWNNGEELTDFNRSEAIFASFEGNQWSQKNSGAATGSNPYTFTGTGITNVTAFSIGHEIYATDI